MAIPSGTHTDWLWPFSLIPRSFNATESDVPPTAIANSEGLDKADDIPNPGNWVFMRAEKWYYGLYFALTTESGWHFRIGSFRYDYVDKYYTFPTFTIKKIKF